MSEKLRQLDFHEMGKRIRERRESLNMNRETLAEQLEVSPQFIADIEYGNKGISIKRLYILCQVLQVSADYVLAGERENEEDNEDLMRAREKVMGILCKCDARQLDGIEKIASIYADARTSWANDANKSVLIFVNPIASLSENR